MCTINSSSLVQWIVISSDEFSGKKLKNGKKKLLRWRQSVDKQFHVNLISENYLEVYFLILSLEKSESTEGQLRVLIKGKNSEI